MYFDSHSYNLKKLLGMLKTSKSIKKTELKQKIKFVLDRTDDLFGENSIPSVLLRNALSNIKKHEPIIKKK